MDELTIIAVMAFAGMGVFIAMGEKMILEPLKNVLSKYVPEPFGHPLYSCPRCMVSFHGTWACWALGILPENLLLLPVYWILACGLQELIDR